MPVHLDGFFRERILEGEHTTAAFEARDGGDAVVSARQREIGPGILVFLTSDGYDRSSKPIARGALSHVGAVDVELIRLRKTVVRGIPLLSSVGLVRDHHISYSLRLRLLIYLLGADGGDD